MPLSARNQIPASVTAIHSGEAPAAPHGSRRGTGG